MNNSQVRSNPKLGSTLSEVLISLAVMSVGVVSLASIFPISVLRSVQATQLTNATNLRYNLEALLGPAPQLYSIGPPWEAGKTYATGDVVIATPLTALKAPPAVYLCTTPGVSGPYEPNWNFADGAFSPVGGGLDGAVQWKTIRLKNYVIDPLGESINLTESLGRTVTDASNNRFDFFGNQNGTPYQSVRAFPGFSNVANAVAPDNYATLPDSWVTQFESRKITGFTSTSCTIGDLPDNSIIPTAFPASANWRVVLFDELGKSSHVRPVTGTTNSAPTATLSWANTLPTGFTPIRVRIEAQSRRYTWMLSVRRGFSGVAYMDAVVFFNRALSIKDEQLYPATFTAVTDLGSDAAAGVWTIDDDGNNVVDDASEIGYSGSDDVKRSWVVIQYSSTGNKPFLKKGGFVTDTDNLRWYRIVDFVEGNPNESPTSILLRSGFAAGSLNSSAPADVLATGYDRAVLLKLDSPIGQSGPQQTGAGVPQGFAMLMRGIVDVYPLRTHMSWGN